MPTLTTRAACARNRCPLLAIPTAIIYAVQESHGVGAVFPRVTGCALLLLSFMVASRRVLPLAMQRLVLKDKKKVLLHLVGLDDGGSVHAGTAVGNALHYRLVYYSTPSFGV